MDQFPEPNNPAGKPLNHIVSSPQPLDANRFVLCADQKIGMDSFFAIESGQDRINSANIPCFRIPIQRASWTAANTFWGTLTFSVIAH